ncbi:MAG: radical SAM family heme chaperone HemW [Anaerolineae bacterium]
MEVDSAVGLYIHIPFCQARCTYCDFNTADGLESYHAKYVQALAQEMAASIPAELRTVYIGGGTPTVLPLLDLARILEMVFRDRVLAPGTEITIEANPGTVDGPMLSGLLTLGVNRLSLGVQSFVDSELRLLGRIHTAAEAVDAYCAARRAGFRNINLDLIFGLPGQVLVSWQLSLARALELAPEHLSLYALSVEPGTPLAASIARGELPNPDPDLAADMYELAAEACAGAGYLHYEISNWAQQSDFCCQHNLMYWRNEAYVGVGAGAHSWTEGQRWANVAPPLLYTDLVLQGDSAVVSRAIIPVELEMGETMMMGLRLLDEGVGFRRFHQRFGTDLRERYAVEIDELQRLGLVQVSDDRIRLSPRGRLLGNQVFCRFLPG